MTKTRVKDWPKNVNQAFPRGWKAVAAITWQRLCPIKQYCHIFNAPQLWLLFAHLGAMARPLIVKNATRWKTLVNACYSDWQKTSAEIDKIKKQIHRAQQKFLREAIHYLDRYLDTIGRAWRQMKYRTEDVLEALKITLPDVTDQKSEEIEILMDLHLTHLAHKDEAVRLRYLTCIKERVEANIAILNRQMKDDLNKIY